MVICSMRSNLIFLICTAGVLAFSSVVYSQDVRGTPGFDYPNYVSIPKTSFKCSEQLFIPGFYADLETRCQVFHFCFKDNIESFLCPTGTTFNQQKLICDVWFSSNCTLAPMYYNVNSGPAMKNAAKKLPMFLKLRSRSKGKLAMQSSTEVYETMASLFENSGNMVSVEDEPSVSGNSEKGKITENADTTLEGKQVLSGSSKIIDGETNLQNEDYESTIEEQDSDNIVYDPVRSGYLEYDQSNAGWQDHDPVYDADSFYNDRYEELQSAGTYESEAEFAKRRLHPSHLAERVRRQTYVVVPEDGDKLTSDPSLLRGIRSPNEHESSGSATGESTDGNETSETETPSPEPFPRPTRIPHHLLGYSTEVPLTSEEFESAIIEDLVAPQGTLADEGRTMYVDEPVAGYGSDDWRRPMYVLVQDENQPMRYDRLRRSPSESLGSATGESADVNATSETETPNPEPFPRPTRMPHHLLGYSTEVPLTSEEFESAIIEDLVAPQGTLADEGRTMYVDEPMTGYESNRRKPMYFLVKDDQFSRSDRPRRSPNEPDSSGSATGDGTDINAASETETSSAEPFPRPTRIPHHLLEYSTEVPLTSEEFESAIIEDLVAPQGTLADEGRTMYVDEPMTHYGSDWRRPMYVVVEDDQPMGYDRLRRSPNEPDSLGSATRESADVNENSETETPSPEPFPRPTRMPHHLLGYSTEVPLTSEEFESAIIEDLVAPQGTLADEGRPVYVDEPVAGYESDDWRRPMYVLVQDDQPRKYDRLRRSPDEPESSGSATGDGTDVNATSETETSSSEPFPRPTRIPHHLLEYSTEVPLTSEEFESAIIEDLVAPQGTLADEGRTMYVNEPITGYESDWRRPMYVMVKDDQSSRFDRLRRSPNEPGSSGSATGDETDVNAASETETSSPEPFPRPTRIPHHLLEYSTEVPLTSEEFESAIIEDLVAPQGTLADEGRILYVDESMTGPLYNFQDARQSYPLNPATGYKYEAPVNAFIIPDESDSENEMGEIDENNERSALHLTGERNEYEIAGTKLQMPEGDQNVYVDEHGYYRTSSEFPEIRGSKFAYPGRWSTPFNYRPGLRPGVPFLRVPYMKNSPLADEAANIIPQMEGMDLGQYIDQRHNAGLPSYQQYQPLNYDDAYEPENPFAYGDRYSNPFVPIREDLLHYSLPGYERESPDIERAESDSHGDLQMENEISSTTSLPITDSDLFVPSGQTDSVNGEILDGDGQSKETYYVFDFDEGEQVSEPIAEGDEAAAMEDSPVDEFGLNTTEAEESQVSNDQSLNAQTLQYGNSQSDSSKQGTKMGNIRTGGNEKQAPSSSTLERLAAMKTTGVPQTSAETSLDSKDKLNNMVFPESMDFGPYGFGANMRQQYGMIDSMHGSKSSDDFLHRKGEGDQSNLSKLSALQERIRSMKQGKFGVFKKYLKSSKEQK